MLTGFAVGAGWQSIVAYANIATYYLTLAYVNKLGENN